VYKRQGLARLAAAGRLDWHQAAGLLAGSAAAAGLDPAEIVRTLESAHRSGSENPKPPALPAPASAAPQPADVLREIDIAAIDGPLPAPDYVIEGAIPAGEVALLGAHGGTGKSFVALALACHVATGRDFGPWRVPRAREVFFVSLEDGAHRLLRRLRSIAAAFGFTTADLSLRLRIIDATAAEPLAAEVRAPGFAPSLEPTDTHRQLRDRVREGALIVIDNASDGFDANENERRLVRAFIRLLRRDLAMGKGRYCCWRIRPRMRLKRAGRAIPVRRHGITRRAPVWRWRARRTPCCCLWRNSTTASPPRRCA